MWLCFNVLASRSIFRKSSIARTTLNAVGLPMLGSVAEAEGPPPRRCVARASTAPRRRRRSNNLGGLLTNRRRPLSASDMLRARQARHEANTRPSRSLIADRRAATPTSACECWRTPPFWPRLLVVLETLLRRRAPPRFVPARPMFRDAVRLRSPPRPPRPLADRGPPKLPKAAPAAASAGAPPRAPPSRPRAVKRNTRPEAFLAARR